MQAPRLNRISMMGILAASLASGLWASARGQAREDPRPMPFVVEGYYRVKWGHSEEFLALYRKNHLPVLRKLQEEGRILRIEAEKPRYHAAEDSRWDYRVRLVFRDAEAAHDEAHEEATRKALYPDQDGLRREEARRFAILDAHWDVVVDPVNLDAK